MSKKIKGKEVKKAEYTIALAGNPNVGKSTIFNSLTGMHQHTGNWPGKTVANATGKMEYTDSIFKIVDIPGTYSIMSNSEEEEIARDYICFGNPDVTIIVLDATCLEKNLNLLFQIMEITKNIIVCVNLLDEAKKKKIKIDLKKLQEILGVPVVGTIAQKKKTLENLKECIYNVAKGKIKCKPNVVNYNNYIENQIAELIPKLKKEIKEEEKEKITKNILRWISLKIIEGNDKILNKIETELKINLKDIELSKNLTKKTELKEEKDKTDKKILKLIKKEKILEEQKKYTINISSQKRLKQKQNEKNLEKQNEKNLEKQNEETKQIKDIIIESIIHKSEEVSKKVCTYENEKYYNKQLKIDKILTSKKFGIPIMIIFLALIFWITIIGANYPSQILFKFFGWLQVKISEGLLYINSPLWIIDMLVNGIYQTLTWVISVMLPPMAIFFPLFTFLEDLGYLPRIAFNMDGFFKKACCSGKQMITMCMGFGCNACGVTGCRIIDSPRERLIAILTNNLVPCNRKIPIFNNNIHNIYSRNNAGNRSIYFINTNSSSSNYIWNPS